MLAVFLLSAKNEAVLVLPSLIIAVEKKIVKSVAK